MSHNRQRRQFILGGLSWLAFLQACSLPTFYSEAEKATNLVTSVPTLQPTYTPVGVPSPSGTPTGQPVSHSSGPIGTPTDTPIPPTSTATATSTSLPTATFTPTPKPTPYPPGPPSKLGIFVTQHSPDVLDIVRLGKPALVKTMEVDANFVRGLKDSSPSTRIVGRTENDTFNFEADPSTLARQFVDRLLPLATEPRRFDSIEAWEAYNEPVAETAEAMKRLADFEAERTRLLGEAGIRSVVGNFPVGHPPLELWPHFEPALAAIRQYNGYLGLHEYSAPVMQFRSGDVQFPGEPDQGDEGWLTLRYRKIYRNFLTPMGYGDTPTLITECGVDGLVQPRPGPADAGGWQDFIQFWRESGLRDDPPGVYMDQLIWYDENLQQDDYIHGAAIFLVGTNDERWRSYDISGPNTGRMTELLVQYLSVHPPTG